MTWLIGALAVRRTSYGARFTGRRLLLTIGCAVAGFSLSFVATAASISGMLVHPVPAMLVELDLTTWTICLAPLAGAMLGCWLGRVPSR
jgi:hypothetical protein